MHDHQDIIGQALLHSLWQISALSVILWLIMRLVSEERAKLRYSLALVAAYSIPVIFIVTYLYLRNVQGEGLAPEYSTVTIDIPLKTSPWNDGYAWLVAGWGIGVLVAFIQSSRYCIGAYRLSKLPRAPIPSNVDRIFSGLARQIDCKRSIELRFISQMNCVFVIGHIKPIIFFPLAMLSHLSEDEIEAVLAHELAHILRNDFFHQFFFTLIRSVFFYHPGTNYIMKVIGKEREHASDDLAVTLINDRKHLATGLLRLGLMQRPNELALSAISEDTEKLRMRVSRLTNFETSLQGRCRDSFHNKITAMFWSICVFSLLGLIGLTSFASSHQSMIQKAHIVKLKDEVCAQLYADNIYENPIYYSGGHAEIIVEGETLMMNQTPLPSATQNAINQILEEQRFQNADIVSIRYFVDDIRLKLAPREGPLEGSLAISRAERGPPSVSYSRKKNNTSEQLG
ncbi:MAG: M56 family metallopeptidase [Hellea sp.]